LVAFLLVTSYTFHFDSISQTSKSVPENLVFVREPITNPTSCLNPVIFSRHSQNDNAETADRVLYTDFKRCLASCKKWDYEAL